MAMAAATATANSFDTRLPVEILEAIFKLCDIQSATNLARSSAFLLQVFRRSKIRITLEILSREFNPLHELFQVFSASDADLDNQHHMLVTPQVLVKPYDDEDLLIRYPTDKSSLVQRVPALSMHPPRKIIIQNGNIDKLIRLCKVVRRWENVFPRYRFVGDIASCRLLRSQEKLRLRKALYRWWLYAIYFHGSSDRAQYWDPEYLTADARMNLVRACSTAGLVEMKDLWEVVKEIIESEICPSVESVGQGVNLTEAELQRLGWGYEQQDHPGIVRTWMKLEPSDLVDFLDRRFSYTKPSLIREMIQRNAKFTDDQESLGIAIDNVLRERTLATGQCDILLRRVTEGGILDFEDLMENRWRASRDIDAGERIMFVDERRGPRRPRAAGDIGYRPGLWFS